jgi:hypothetical protein
VREGVVVVVEEVLSVECVGVVVLGVVVKEEGEGGGCLTRRKNLS